MSSTPAIERVVEILCDHRSQRLRADDVEIVADPLILDLYAVRVSMDSARPGDDYVVRASGEVEEVRFDEWPPRRHDTETPRARASARTAGPEGHGATRGTTTRGTTGGITEGATQEAKQGTTRGTTRGTTQGTSRDSDSDARGTARRAVDRAHRRDAVMRIEEVMSRDVQHCRPEDTLATAARLMWEHDCGCAPVCESDNGQHVVGMITDRDIVMCALFQGRALGNMKVRDAMSRGVSACRAEDVSFTVEQLMRDKQIRRVPVTDNEDRLIGIVSLADLVRHAASRERAASSADVTEAEISETLAAICEPRASRGAAGGRL